MAITPLPAAPSRAVPSTFSTLADAWVAALSTFVTEANALQVDVNAKQSAAALSATGSAASATTSANSAAVALAASNYKGEWTALTGAASIPYSVSLAGRFWMLNTNVSNVATEIPGVSTKWTEIYPVLRSGINLIGTPGQMGFGVGICPPQNLPPGMVGLPGYDQLGHDNYGNYQFTDGSIMIWVPKFYYRIGHASNPTYATYGVNSIDIKGMDTYATTTEANAAGYALHRAFIDGGEEKLGFFRDKYKWSKVANGTGYTAASIKNGLPLSSAAAHNPFADCTGGANYNYSAIDLAHRRDGVDGDVNASSIFFASSIFMHGAIAMLSMAHGQAATSTANCAWYLTNKNYPKGCNNNALSDYDDTTVKWESDGYETATGVYACGKTGSAGYGGGAGNVFAKSTHNGQNCGSADDNGLMYEIVTGFTCIAKTGKILSMTKTNPCVIEVTGHGLENGDVMQIGTAITQAGWVGLNDKVWPITKLTDDMFSVAFDASAIATAYDAGTDPGTCVLGKFYVAKEATAMKDFTHDNTTATGHWGATGVAEMMDRIVMPWGDGDALVQKFGDGTNQVLSEATSGVGYILAGMGFPKDANGNSPTGTNLFGLDYYYTYVRDAMFLIVSCNGSSTTRAGVWSVYFNNARANTGVGVSARSACYHV